MDGILIDSEPYWQEEERNAFKTVGIDITPEMQLKTHGVDADEVVDYWYNFQPWENVSHERLKEMVFENVEKHIQQKGKAMVGVSSIIEFFFRKKIPLRLRGPPGPGLPLQPRRNPRPLRRPPDRARRKPARLSRGHERLPVYHSDPVGAGVVGIGGGDYGVGVRPRLGSGQKFCLNSPDAEDIVEMAPGPAHPYPDYLNKPQGDKQAWNPR